MKQLIIFFLLLIGFQSLYAQEYNIKGDQAFQENNFEDARIWFSEGLPGCDQYSIKRLTDIWKEKAEMRRRMRLTMQKCFKCLEPLAQQKEQDAMFLISDYYKHGIGTEKDSVKADFWLKEYGLSLGFSPIENDSTLIPKIKRPKKGLLSSRFYSFITYAYSPTMPVGFTIGGFSKWGIYAGYKTSLSSVNYDYECNNTKVYQPEINEEDMYSFGSEKWKSWMVNAGILGPIIKEKLYFSVGGGYAKRHYYRQITFSKNNNTAWCYNTQASYEDFVVEVGGMLNLKKWIITGGVNSTGFRDLDMYIGFGHTF